MVTAANPYRDQRTQYDPGMGMDELCDALNLGLYIGVTSPSGAAPTISSAIISFLQSGSGAVATTLQDRGRLEINLWDALSAAERADMGTASVDISAAIATAIGWFGANGGTLVVPGYFGVGAAGIALASKTGIVIEGRGPSAGFKALGASSTTVAANGVSWIRMTSCTRCGIRNLYIDNNSKAHNVISGSSNTDCFVEGNYITAGGLNASIMFVGGTGNSFVRNTIKDSAAGASRGMWIGNTNASESETDVLIAQNYVNNTTATAIGGTMVRATIQSNICIDSDGSGIVVSGAASLPSSRVTITGNVCKGNTFHGIQWDVSYSTTADLLDGIAAVGNVCDSNTLSGVFAVYGTRGVIANNICKDNGDNGIFVDEMNGLSITGNVCYDSRSGGSRTQDRGVYINAQIHANSIANISVSANVCYNNVVDGIRVSTVGASDSVSGVAVVGNVTKSNGNHGIILVEGSAATITSSVVSGNVTQSNGTADFRLDPLDVAISGNKYSTMSGANTTGAFTFTDQDATPSVKGREYFKTANTMATTITAFDDGAPGQRIEVLFTDANTTVSDAGTLKLAGAFTSTADDVMVLRFNGTNWYEVSRSVN